MTQAREWQFDGLVGPTHNYAGLALGNLAAANNKGAVSNPRLAALQGIEKMRFVRDLGMGQAFLPPHYRPVISQLERLGFRGSRAEMIQQAAEQAPGFLASIYSSSFMWTANAATVTPSSDSADGKLHLTPANLTSHFHRSIEAEFSYRLLKAIFRNETLFSIHKPIHPCGQMGDEGAANHMRIINNEHCYAKHVFVYGNSEEKTFENRKFIPRQHRAASEAVARLHGINPADTIYLQQSPQVIDQGVFHHDVIGMNTGRLMIHHAESFIPEHQAQMRRYAATLPDFQYREIAAADLTVSEAVSTYLFNSQLLEVAPGSHVLVAPSEVANHPRAYAIAEQLKVDGLLSDVHYLDVRESMRNGGGPACLRLRVVLTSEEVSAMHPNIVANDSQLDQLSAWVKTHYRDRLSFDDLRDPQFAEELDVAYRALEEILALPGLYFAS